MQILGSISYPANNGNTCFVMGYTLYPVVTFSTSPDPDIALDDIGLPDASILLHAMRAHSGVRYVARLVMR